MLPKILGNIFGHFYFCVTFKKVITMKNYWILILAILVTGVFPQTAFSDNVHVKGKWGDDRIRTIFPKVPEVSIDGSVLSIYSADSLSDLTITVVDAEGKVILEECITISSGETVHFTLGEITGMYQVRLSHKYGYLQGDFIL